jgi:hypothetical protein
MVDTVGDFFIKLTVSKEGAFAGERLGSWGKGKPCFRFSFSFFWNKSIEPERLCTCLPVLQQLPEY